jgi:hypothetical protein
VSLGRKRRPAHVQADPLPASTVAGTNGNAGVTTHYLMRLVRYAFLAPDITKAIRAGTQSARISVESRREPIPLDSSEQRRLFGLPDR